MLLNLFNPTLSLKFTTLPDCTYLSRSTAEGARFVWLDGDLLAGEDPVEEEHSAAGGQGPEHGAQAETTAEVPCCSLNCNSFICC